MTLWSSPTFLKTAQNLRRAGVVFPITPGVRVARGFADLGAEEFCLLPGGKLVSIFTGEKSQLPEDFEEHFFVVPDYKALIEAFFMKEISLPQISLREDGAWMIDGRKVNSLEAELSQLLLNSVKGSEGALKPPPKLVMV